MGLFLTSRIEPSCYLTSENSVWSLSMAEQFSRVTWNNTGQPGLEHARIHLDRSAGNICINMFQLLSTFPGTVQLIRTDIAWEFTVN